MSETHALSDVVRPIAAKFSVVDGKPQLTDDDFVAAWQQLLQLPHSQREQAVKELVALAFKIQRADPALADVAVAQLSVLAGELLGSWDAARRLLESQGVDLSKAAQFLGDDTAKRPVAAGKLTDKGSLFSLIRDQKNK